MIDGKVLIVGGAGFVGSNLAKELLKSDISELIIIDNLLSSDTVNIPDDKRVRFVFGSINESKVLGQIPDDLKYAFHLSCYHGNQSSIEDPFKDHEHNTLTSLSLFDRLSEIPTLKKVVYAAAGCAVAEKTYDDAQATDEDAPVSLFHDSPYSISKLVGEFYGNYFYKQRSLPFVRARFQNVYGPGEILGAGQWRGTRHTVWRNVTPTFIFKSLHQEALPLDNGGLTTRDFIFVGDMARGLIACAEKGQPGEAYNLATGKETAILELAELINKFTGNKTPFDLKPARDWDGSGCRYGSTQKSKEQLGFEAKVDIQEGIEATVQWTKENMSNIKRCMAQHKIHLPEVSEYL